MIADLLVLRLAVWEALLAKLLYGGHQVLVRLGTLEAGGVLLLEAAAPVHEAVLQKVDQWLDVASVALPLVVLKKKEEHQYYGCN